VVDNANYDGNDDAKENNDSSFMTPLKTLGLHIRANSQVKNKNEANHHEPDELKYMLLMRIIMIV
jgi:hypothetical protein